MSEIKKASIKFYIDNRIQGELFKGVRFYPVYARVGFLGNNTNIKIKTRSGKVFFTDLDSFKFFEEIVYEGKYHESMLDRLPLKLLLDKEMLILKAVQKEYENSKDRFSFKDFTHKFKFWEQDVTFFLKRVFAGRLALISKEQIDDFFLYNEIDFDAIYKEEEVIQKWVKAIGGEEKITPEIKAFGESMICYEHYHYYLFNVKLAKTVQADYHSTERGTIWAWMNGDDKTSFVDHSKDYWPSDHYSAGYWRFPPLFRKIFELKESKILDYQTVIDDVVRNEIKGDM